MLKGDRRAGRAAVLDFPADGYTFLLPQPQQHVTQVVSEINNLWKELTLLGMCLSMIGRLWAQTNRQAGKYDDIIAYAKAHPAKSNTALPEQATGWR
jgi:hypothetical protein